MRKECKVRRVTELLSSKLNTPIIIIQNKVNAIESLLQPYIYLLIDFEKLTDGVLRKYLPQISSLNSQIILFQNIDKITDGADRDCWESIVTLALKQENYPLELQDKDGYFKHYELPFHNMKIIATCAEYPEYLTDRGMLGEIIDLSEGSSKK